MNAVEEYIAAFPAEVQEQLHQIRNLILKEAAQAEENIAYGMPAYKTFGKPLIYFAAFKKHIGLYATPSGHAAFEEELASYKQGKGSVQFPLDQELPLDLIADIIRFRVKENESKAKA
tara:strand:+ start:219 stop:572 length:354 start_codon:yes stop_codon:yes gene_type:complete